MKTLIVHAHPEPKSFNRAMRDVAEATLTGMGHEVTVSDLHAMGFNPVSSADDFGSRRDPDHMSYGLEQRHNWKAGTLAPDIVDEVEKLLDADFLLLVFPLFWFSVPAIMKGWFDRVLLSGVFYGGRRVYDRGPLLGKRAMVATSLGGRDVMFGDEAVHPPLETVLTPVNRGTLQYIGMEVLPPFAAWHVPYIDDDARKGYLKDFEAHLRAMDTLEPLPRPTLDDFDETLAPIKR